jgi:hypothetical protein
MPLCLNALKAQKQSAQRLVFQDNREERLPWVHQQKIPPTLKVVE